MTHQQKWGASGRRCLSGHPDGLGCESCSPGLKKLHAHHTASPAGLTTQEGSISFARWHFPRSTDTHRESTRLGLIPQAATLRLASPSPHNSGSSEMLVIQFQVLQWCLIMKTSQKETVQSNPPERDSLGKGPESRCAWPDVSQSQDGEHLWRKSGSSSLAAG